MNVYANPEKSEEFARIWAMFMFIEIRLKFLCKTSDSSSFHGQEHNIIR